MPYFAHCIFSMLYNRHYWITKEEFSLNSINLSDAMSVNIKERDGWGETSKTVKSPGCLATKPPCNGGPASFIKAFLVFAVITLYLRYARYDIGDIPPFLPDNSAVSSA
jgi:hypothetical protein